MYQIQCDRLRPFSQFRKGPLVIAFLRVTKRFNSCGSSTASDIGALDCRFQCRYSRSSHDSSHWPHGSFSYYLRLIRVAVIFGGPLLAPFAFSWSAVAVLGILYVVTGLGITVGFHRLLTHRSYKTPPVVE